VILVAAGRARRGGVMLAWPAMSRLARLALIAPLAAALLSGCTPKERIYESVVQLARYEVAERDEKGAPQLVDAELEWDPCPGDQFETVRGGPEFAACMTKYKVGDMLPVVVRHSWSTRGYYRWAVLKVGDCDRPPSQGDVSSFEKIQECNDVKIHDVVSGFECNRKPYAELVKVCPWMRRE
jgi:hypothetical protein